MRYNILLLFFITLFGFSAQAQQGDYIFHKVKSGETEYGIAHQYNITVEQLEKFNPDIKSGLKENMTLLIPKQKEKPKKEDQDQPKTLVHEVEAGETLYSISQRYNVNIEELKKFNPELKDGLKAGQQLIIPLIPVTANAGNDGAGDTYRAHKVEAGETLYSLAIKYGVSTKSIKAANPGMEELKAGDIIKIPMEKETKPEASSSDKARLAEEARRAGENKTPLANDYLSGDYHIHKVEKTETAYSISKQYHISLDSLYLLNPDAENGLRIGQVLKLPLNRKKYSKQQLLKKPADELARDTAAETSNAATDSSGGYFLYRIKTGDSFYSLKNRFNVSREEIIQLNPEISSGLEVDKYIILPQKDKPEDVGFLDKIFTKVESNETVGKPDEKQISRKDSMNHPSDYQVPAEVFADTLKIDIHRNFRVGVLLPFNALTDTSFAYDMKINKGQQITLDFYNGLLMAADTLSKQGMNLSFNVFDTRNSLVKVKEDMSEIKSQNFDMLIGPLYQKNVEYVADELKGSPIPVISPLSKTVNVENRPNLIKCIPGADAAAEQISGLINLKYSNSRIIFATSTKTEDKETVRQIKARLLPRSNGSFVDNVTYVEGETSTSELREMMATDKSNIVVVLSEDPVFLSSLINRLRQMRSLNISVIGPTKLLDIPTLDMDYLNSLNLTMPDVSFIDYTDRTTQDFITRFRAKYGAEPSAYAFQGYDVGMYFLEKLWKSGNYVLQTVGNEKTLMSTGFKLTREQDGGYENHFMYVTGIRDFKLIKVSYNKEEKASLK